MREFCPRYLPRAAAGPSGPWNSAASFRPRAARSRHGLHCAQGRSSAPPADEAKAPTTEPRQYQGGGAAATVLAGEMGGLLRVSSLAETRAFVHSIVKELLVKPGKAATVCSTAAPEGSALWESGFRRNSSERWSSRVVAFRHTS